MGLAGREGETKPANPQTRKVGPDLGIYLAGLVRVCGFRDPQRPVFAGLRV